MERTRSPIEDPGILALMANWPLMANAQLTADALFNGNELTAEPSGQQPSKHADPAPKAPEGEREESKRGLFDRIDHWFWTLEQRAIEARLAEATDIYDLEVRIREIERGRPWWSH